MAIWHNEISLDAINSFGQKSMTGYLDINVTEILDDTLVGTMPVNEKTKQPFGLLHGGSSCVLAESLGSIASGLVVDQSKYICVGQSINANHIKSARDGLVKGICKAIHVGKKSHVWEINIYNEQEQLVCVSRLTVAVIEKKK